MTSWKCAVLTCSNRTDAGKFIGLLCAPCHKAIGGMGGLAAIKRVIQSAESGIEAGRA